MSVVKTFKKTYWATRRLGRELEWGIRSKIALSKGKKRAHFLHINKAAGSALKEALFQRRISRYYVLRLHRHVTTLRDVPVGDKFFFFLRDPLTRFVSGFNHRLNKGKPKYFTDWSEQEAKVFEEFKSAESLALGLSSGSEVKRNLAEFGMRNIFHVRSSFYDWFESDEYFDSRRDDLIMVGFQESFGRDFSFLTKLLGLPKQTTVPSDFVTANRSSGPAKENKWSKQDLSEEAANNLKQWYAKDIYFYRKCLEIAPQYWPQEE